MSEDCKKIIEINGVKMEVDLRQAKVVDSYRVGDSVKVLEKRYNETYEVNYGAIIGMADFQKLPTIELLVVNHDGNVKFLSYNANTKDTEIAPLNPQEIRFDYENIFQILDRKIQQEENELREAKERKRAFVDAFGTIFRLDKQEGANE